MTLSKKHIGGIVIVVCLIGVTAFVIWTKKLPLNIHHYASYIDDFMEPNEKSIEPLPPGRMNHEKEMRIEDQKTVIGSFYNDKFKELDDLAKEWRTTKDRYSDGRWKLSFFYRWLQEPPGEKDKYTEDEWQKHFAQMQKWLAYNPQSITANIVHGDMMRNYAWEARGYGYVSTVSEEGWRLFKERLAAAEQILQNAKQLPEKCPHWYYAMAYVAMGQKWDMDRYNKMIEEAIAFEPAYEKIYEQKYVHLRPEWYGSSGEAERFADEVYERLGEKNGPAMYFFIADSQWRYHHADLFRVSKLSWQKVKHGFRISEKLFGESAGRLNRYATLAVAARDKKTTRRVLLRLGDNQDVYSYWGQSQDFYEWTKDWAFR
jgi:hypothetical protein